MHAIRARLLLAISTLALLASWKLLQLHHLAAWRRLATPPPNTGFAYVRLAEGSDRWGRRYRLDYSFTSGYKLETYRGRFLDKEHTLSLCNSLEALRALDEAIRIGGAVPPLS